MKTRAEWETIRRSADDEIQAAYWHFCRCARAKPPVLVCPDAYKRRAEAERALQTKGNVMTHKSSVPSFTKLTAGVPIEVQSQREYVEASKRPWVSFASHGSDVSLHHRVWLYRLGGTHYPTYLALLVAAGREPRTLLELKGIDLGIDWIRELSARAGREEEP